MSYYPFDPPYFTPPPSPPLLDRIGPVSPIYIILVTGMVFFMFSNVMPGLLPDPQKIGHLAPMILQWGFVVCIFALLAQMTGLIPGVPRVHITYVHMAIAFLLFILMWNHVVMTLPEEPKPSSSSSSSSAKREERKEEKERKDEEEEEESSSPWDDLRAHPSAFLTTKLNRLLPWPFPMGKASGRGKEVWWDSGTPAHVGHFNRPDPEIRRAAEEAEKKKQKEKEIKAKEAEKMKERAKAKEDAEKEAAEKAKKKEEEARRLRELERAKAAAIEAAKRKAIEDRRVFPGFFLDVTADHKHHRQKQKLWRTKYLAMIIGISLLNKTFGFFLLLLFSVQILSQEMNAEPAPSATASSASASASSGTSSAATATARATDDRDKEKTAAKLDAMRKEKEKAGKAEAEGDTTSSSGPSKPSNPAKPSSSSSSSSPKPSDSDSTSSSSKEASGSTKSSSDPPSHLSKPSSSSSSSEKAISGAAVKEAAGTSTVTGGDPDDSHMPVPYQLGFGMHYIHTKNKEGELDLPANFIPSEGMAHPLMTTTYSGWAN